MKNDLACDEHIMKWCEERSYFIRVLRCPRNLFPGELLKYRNHTCNKNRDLGWRCGIVGTVDHGWEIFSVWGINWTLLCSWYIFADSLKCDVFLFGDTGIFSGFIKVCRIWHCDQFVHYRARKLAKITVASWDSVGSYQRHLKWSMLYLI